jgi:hypothetical protein
LWRRRQTVAAVTLDEVISSPNVQIDAAPAPNVKAFVVNVPQYPHVAGGEVQPPLIVVMHC